MTLLTVSCQIILMIIMHYTIKKVKKVDVLVKVTCIWIIAIPLLFLQLIVIREEIQIIPIRLIISEFYLVYLFVLKLNIFRNKIKDENKENKEVLIGKIRHLQKKIGITRKRTIRHRLQQIYRRINKRIRLD